MSLRPCLCGVSLRGLLRLNPFAMRPALTHGPLPTIPAKAGIQINACWIPAFAGMIGLLSLVDNRKSNIILNSR